MGAVSLSLYLLGSLSTVLNSSLSADQLLSQVILLAVLQVVGRGAVHHQDYAIQPGQQQSFALQREMWILQIRGIY